MCFSNIYISFLFPPIKFTLLISYPACFILLNNVVEFLTVEIYDLVNAKRPPCVTLPCTFPWMLTIYQHSTRGAEQYLSSAKPEASKITASRPGASLPCCESLSCCNPSRSLLSFPRLQSAKVTRPLTRSPRTRQQTHPII